MDYVGVIGYGQMGSMLVSGFLTSGLLGIDEVVVTSKRQESRDTCATAWPGIGIAATNRELARRCGTIILAVRPQEVREIVREIAPALVGDEHIVSLATGIDLEELEAAFTGPVSRVVPTVTSAVGQGTTLVCHGRRVGRHDALRVEGLFSSIGIVLPVREGELPAATLLASCGPALFAVVVEELAGATARASELSMDRARILALETVAATAAYLRETGESPGDLIERVATSGGVTEVGVRKFRERLPAVFDEGVAAMLERYDAVGGRRAEI